MTARGRRAIGVAVAVVVALGWANLELAHRVFQIPRSEEDLQKRLELASHMSIVGGVTGV